MFTTRKAVLVLAIVLLSSALLALNNGEKITSVMDHVIKLTGKEDHSISLADASRLTSNFQKGAEADAIIGGYFGKEALVNILQQEGCVGLRYYYGMDQDGIPRMVLVGVNEDGNDMIEGQLAERATLCPPLCSEKNELNSPTAGNQMSANF